MNIDELFGELLRLSIENNISKPYLVGGIPRDMVMGSVSDFSDFDITTNNSDITRLAITTAYTFDELFKIFSDGHISVYFDDYILDFSSNFISTKAVIYLDSKLGTKDKKLHEVYSRDFTINTLHMDIETKEISDPIGLGLDDIKRKIIRTPIPPEITISDDPRRAYRAINFAVRFGFDIDDDLVKFLKNNAKEFADDGLLYVKPESITSIISRALEVDATRTIEYLLDVDLFSSVPLVGRFKDELIKRKLVKQYIDIAQNY